jgi:glycosyltransferase involved in cell wall biosynthesis
MTNIQNSISVIIPVYNRCNLIDRAIKSVLEQTRRPDEIIVIDDGSTDGTDKIIINSYPDIILLKQKNRGVSCARNNGIKNAKGTWITLLDSDDEWLPEKLEKQLMTLQDNSSSQICHTDEIWIRNGVRVNPMKKHRKYGGNIYKYCLPLCVISPSSVMIHKDIFKDVGLFDENLPVCEDYDLWLRICSRYPVLYLRKKLIKKYGGHDDQLSLRYWGMDRFRIRALEKMINDPILSENNRKATVATAINKGRILQKGFLKHNHKEEAEKMMKKLAELETLYN